ncbi:MAG: heme exporter protein CcmB [Alphaproteobacteria bacterium]|nr:heme exporter protein CcmB [Alphaproteobacteria bacterium]
MIRQTWAVLYKELLTELRQPARISGIFFFALALVLLVGVASPSGVVLQKMAGATLWLGLMLASTRALDQSYQVELEHNALEGMVLWPVDPRAVYYGKAVANAVMLLLVCCALTPFVLAMCDAGIAGNKLLFVAFLAAGCSGLAAPGTLFGLITGQARGSSVLLPLLLFPIVVPMLLAAARGTMLVMEGGPSAEMEGPGWLKVLLVFNLLHWSLGGIFYGYIIEDG